MPNTMVPQAGQAPSVATDAICAMAAPTDGSRWHLDYVAWSYSAAPTGGQLLITWGSTTMTFYIIAGGPSKMDLDLVFPINTAVTITLKSGAGAVVGTVYPKAHTEF